uniref:Uncharacterized protein n=1 Tax=Oryza meridionalis TaxID=40149 RepID=A0A0E0DH60_9ORYZ
MEAAADGRARNHSPWRAPEWSSSSRRPRDRRGEQPRPRRRLLSPSSPSPTSRGKSRGGAAVGRKPPLIGRLAARGLVCASSGIEFNSCYAYGDARNCAEFHFELC